jgi:hypothetical protein
MSSWEDNIFLGTLEIVCIEWNPNVLCRADSNLPPVPILNQKNTIYATLPYLFKIHVNVILIYRIVSS